MTNPHDTDAAVRRRGVFITVGGVTLFVVALVVNIWLVGTLTESDTDVESVPKFLLALPALGLTLGLALFYAGIMRVLLGEKVAGIDWGGSAFSKAALGYLFGFIVLLGILGYIAVLWFIGDLQVSWLPPPP